MSDSMKRFNRPRSWAAAAVVLFVAGGITWVSRAAAPAGAPARADTPPGPIEWDERAAEELTAALHKMHEVWNSGDIKALKKLLVGDDVLVTFELDPATHKPIRLASRQELFAFVDGVSDDADADRGRYTLAHPAVKCRATRNLGICTEECFITIKMPGGVEEKYDLRSTAIALRYPDGWKWIQWHMSTAGPVRIYKDGKLLWQGPKDQRPKDLLKAAASGETRAAEAGSRAPAAAPAPAAPAPAHRHD
jgi:hypothetical protein